MSTREWLVAPWIVLAAATSWQADGGAVSLQQGERPPVVAVQAAPPADAPLLQQSDLVYAGAFRVPSGSIAGSSFDFGGNALTFDRDRRSLFLVGHDWHQQVAEIDIPEARIAKTVAELATATVRQPFADATGGRLGLVGEGAVKIGGLLAYQGSLYLSAYLFYDGSGTQKLSHYVSSLDLRAGADTRGPFQIRYCSPESSSDCLGAGFFDGYFGLVPAEWQAALGGPALTGNCCLSVISRTSYGPAAFAIDPAAIGVKPTTTARALVYYPPAHPLLEKGSRGDGWSNTSTLFNGTTQVKGVVFPEHTRSVLFFGRQGLGPFCYGPGTADRTIAGTPANNGPDRNCYDPSDDNKGNHGYPYAYQVWAYDAADLAVVKRRIRDPWTVRPYATWKLELPFASDNPQIRGVAYDPATGRIFVSAAYGDGERPLIHVFSLGAARQGGV